MLPLTADTVRLSLHVLAATVWVGGQFVLVGLLPTVRGLGEDVPRIVARAYNRIAWPAFAVVVVTGIWNLVELPVGRLRHRVAGHAAREDPRRGDRPGVAAAVHAGVRLAAADRRHGARSAAVASIAAVVLGIMLHG